MGQANLIIATDTLPYFGALDQIFALLVRYLAPTGSCIFTIEITHKADYLLSNTARFSHHPDYITRLCTEHLLSVHHHERVALRTQQRAYVEGMLFILQK